MTARLSPQREAVTPAEIRLAEYGERTKSYSSGTDKALHQIATDLAAELAAVRAERAEAQARVAALEASGRELLSHCTAEYGGPGYTHCELSAGHDGQHESELGHMHRATWGGHVMTRDASTIAAVDVLASELEAEAERLALAEAYKHQPEPFEAEFAALACTHPEACSCDAEYEGWTEHIAKRAKEMDLYRQAAAFNAAHPVGTAVLAYPGFRPEDDKNATRIDTTTRSRATVLGGHTAVVWVDGHGACIALTHIDVHPGGAA